MPNITFGPDRYDNKITSPTLRAAVREYLETGAVSSMESMRAHLDLAYAGLNAEQDLEVVVRLGDALFFGTVRNDPPAQISPPEIGTSSREEVGRALKRLIKDYDRSLGILTHD